MTEEELAQLAAEYVVLEGYTDPRSILNVMLQEYPGEFDRRTAMKVICKVLKKDYERKEA